MNSRDDQTNDPVGVPAVDQRQGSRSDWTPPQRDYSAPRNAAANIIRDQLDSIYAGKSSEQTPHTTPSSDPADQGATPDSNLVDQSETPQASQLAESHESQPTSNSAQEQPSQQPSQQPENIDTSHNMNTAPPALSSGATTSAMDASVPESLQPQQEYRPQASEEQWKQYHSAWQKYYQMYYERYYVNHINANQPAATPEKSTTQSADQDASADSPEEAISQQTAMLELRNQIRDKVRDSADKVKKSRHFMPILAGMIVLLVFVGIQFNRQIIGSAMAYVTPGNIEPQNIIVDPTVDTEVGPEPMMVIPKINVSAPVVYGAAPDHDSQMKAMENGIAHFSIPGANAVPGQVGNAVFAAHSSNDAFASGDYKFVFAWNEKLVQDDVIYMNYEGERITYKVTTTEVVMPSEVSKIQIDTDKPMLTLISCVPLGTAEKRLLVFAEQVSPNPSGASSGPSQEAPEEHAAADTIPGQPSPSLFERMFGRR